MSKKVFMSGDGSPPPKQAPIAPDDEDEETA